MVPLRKLPAVYTALAELIIDALCDAKIVGKDEIARAIAIATEEIDVRKALGDY